MIKIKYSNLLALLFDINGFHCDLGCLAFLGFYYPSFRDCYMFILLVQFVIKSKMCSFVEFRIQSFIFRSNW